MTPHDILIRPLITERSMDDMAEKKYTFEVDRRSNKTQIKKAVESIFGVKVQKVNTMNMLGKVKRQGLTSGRRRNWKKAIVTLTPESADIEFFDGM